MGNVGVNIFIRLMLILFILCLFTLFMVEFMSAEFVALVTSMVLNASAIVIVMAIRKFKKKG